MTKKKVKKIILITLSIILALLLLGVIISNTMSVTISGRCTEYVNDYSEYYLFFKKHNTFSLINLPGAGAGPTYKIWFLPGQKRKVLNKIKEDINAELTNAVAENSDILKYYEIVEDYNSNKYIYVYYYNQDSWNHEQTPELISRFNSLTDEMASGKIGGKIELHYVLINGYGGTSLGSGGYILKFVEIEESLQE